LEKCLKATFQMSDDYAPIINQRNSVNSPSSFGQTSVLQGKSLTETNQRGSFIWFFRILPEVQFVITNDLQASALLPEHRLQQW